MAETLGNCSFVGNPNSKYGENCHFWIGWPVKSARSLSTSVGN